MEKVRRSEVDGLIIDVLKMGDWWENSELGKAAMENDPALWEGVSRRIRMMAKRYFRRSAKWRK